MFMDFLKSLTLFGEKAPPERVQELIEIIEGQADLDAQFNVSACFIVIISANCKLYFSLDKITLPLKLVMTWSP